MSRGEEETASDDAAPTSGGSGLQSRLIKLAASAASTAREYKESRPIASVDVGIAKLSHIHRVATGTKFTLYADRIQTPKGEHPLTRAVRADAEAAGGFQRRRDRRELYLRVEGDGWSISQQCQADKGEKVRAFASSVNAAVQALPGEASTSAITSDGGTASDPADAIRKLAELRDAGAITVEDFEAKRRELLDRL